VGKKQETGFGAVRENIRNRPPAMTPPRVVVPVQVKMEEINPPFNESNWQHMATFKFERTGFEETWGSTAPKDHWVRNTPNRPFGIGDNLFFVHPQYPNEVARLIGGGANEYGAYLFQKRGWEGR